MVHWNLHKTSISPKPGTQSFPHGTPGAQIIVHLLPTKDLPGVQEQTRGLLRGRLLKRLPYVGGRDWLPLHSPSRHSSNAAVTSRGASGAARSSRAQGSSTASNEHVRHHLPTGARGPHIERASLQNPPSTS